MLEEYGNLWDMEADWRCITTNSDINRFGELVMGRGCALQAKKRYPGLAKYAAERVRSNGNVVQAIKAHNLILFPVKHHWPDQADLSLIETSANQLAWHADEHNLGRILLPRPGCGNGRVEWDDVCPILEKAFEGRNDIVVVTYPPKEKA